MKTWKIIFVLIISNVINLGFATTQIITAADFKGVKARLGTGRQVLIVLPENGINRKVDAPVGRIRVSAWFRFNDKGTDFRLATYNMMVNGASSTQTVDALDSGQPITCEFINRDTTLNITLSQGTMPPEAKSELRAMQLKLRQQNEDPDKDVEDNADDEPVTDADGMIDALSLPLPTVLLERLEITTMSGPLIISEVRRDKVTYAPGAKGVVTVTITNLNTKSETGNLTVNLSDNLTNLTTVFNGEVTIDASTEIEKSFTVDFGGALWGRGLEARIETKDGTDRGANAVSVINNPWMCALHGTGLAQFGSQYWNAEEAEKNAVAIAAGNVNNNRNIYEAFAWAPCDFSHMTIDNDMPFYSGQTQYSKNRVSLQTLNKVFHQYGISNVTYGKSCACGLSGVNYALKHPEQMNVFGPAGFAHEAISTDIIDRMMENRYRQHGKDEDFWQYWISAWTAIGNIDAVNFGVDEIARSAKQFGWDAVRYDGHFNAWADPVMSARVVKYAADRLRKEVPGFGIGYNYMGPQHSTPQGAFGDAELAACANGGGLIMSEYYRGILGNVRDNIEHLRWGGDAVRLHGGYWLAIIDDTSPWNAALVLASGARIMGGSSAFDKFATRFSGYILDPSMRRLQDPGKIIKPSGKVNFLWDSFIYEKPLGKDSTALILQLVNVTDNFSFMPNKRPPTGINPEQKNVEFQLSLPVGYSAENLFACDDYRNFTPQPAKITNGVLTIPRVGLWTMVVVTLKKDNPKQSLYDICAQPISFDKNEVISPEEFRAQLKIGAEFGPQTAEKVKKGKFFVTPEVLDAIFKQGEPVNAAPGEKVYQPIDFNGHRDGLDRAIIANETPLPIRRNGKPDIHFARGIYAHVDRLEEAFARVKNLCLTTSSLDSGRLACGSVLDAKNSCCLSNFPNAETLGNSDLLVLDEVPATSFSATQRRQIQTFVQNGGSLLVLGGWYALSKGNYEGSFLEEILPVATMQKTYLLRLRGTDQIIKATPDFAAVFGVPAPAFGNNGAIEWMNHIKVKDGAKVLLTAGTQPLLVSGVYGKGRVIVFAGSHSGEPKAPYWSGQAWIDVLAAAANYLTKGSEEVTPPDEELRGKILKTRAALDKMDKDAPEVIAGQLKTLLTTKNEDEALYVATYMLENPKRVPYKQCDDMIDDILPFITVSDEWRRLADEFMEDAPTHLYRLVAEIAAVSVDDLSYNTLKTWQAELDEVTFLRCVAACGDKAALPYLRDMDIKLNRQEKVWNDLTEQHIQTTDTVRDIYKTRLLRPYVAYARIKCGERNDDTVSALCRGLVELPYYAWRQRWILDGAYNAMQEAQSSGDPVVIGNVKARIQAQQRIIKTLDLAVEQAAILFKPDIIGHDNTGRVAAARAISNADSRKSLSLCLAYLDACTTDDLKNMADLQTAKLDSIRFFYQARVK